MQAEKTKNQAKMTTTVETPPVLRFLFEDPRMSWLWLLARLYVGYIWLTAGWEKVFDPVWVGPKAGVALSGFVNGALAKTAGEHPAVQMWYAGFLEKAVLPAAPFWSGLVAFGELLVGIALIVGVFTGVAAFFGGFMNVNYLLAGTVSTNPTLLVLAFLLMVAWKTAGWLGLDRWVLPLMSGKKILPGRENNPRTKPGLSEAD